MIRLRKILLYNYLYCFIIFVTLIYVIIVINQPVKEISKTNFTGVITNYKIDGNLLSLDIKNKEKIKANYYIKTKEEKEYLIKNISYGITIYLKGEFTRPSNNTIPNTFNYNNYLKSKSILYVLKIDSYEITSFKTSFLYKVKNIIIKRIDNITKSKEYIKTFILGDKTDLDQEEYQRYQNNGISHLFALSGMHISLFVSIINLILTKITKIKIVNILIVSIFLLIYMFLSNYTSSILRASIFFILVSVNDLFNTNIKKTNLLLLTGSIILFQNPYIIYDLGFQYSFIITFSILLTSNNLTKTNYLINILKISLISFLFSIPISLNNFYELNLISPFLNIIFIPLITFIVYPLSLLTFIFPFLDNILFVFINLIEFLNTLFSKLNLTIIFSKLNVFISVIYYLILILFITKKKIRYLLLLLIILLVNKYKFNFDYNAYIYFLDVGQGDSILIRKEFNQEVILIDTGGKLEFEKDDWEERQKTYNLSANTITFLKSIGITKLNKIIITHGDSDHIKETLNMVTNFNVEEIVLNQGDKTYEEKNVIANFNNISYEIKNTKFDLTLLNTKVFDNENDNSLVLNLKLYNYRILLMGDATIKTENSILTKLSKIDLLKVGHHGSNTSTSDKLLEITKPTTSIISSGRNNLYNHPSPKVINKLEKNKIKYYNTQNSGTIKLKINQKAHSFKTYKP